MSRMKSVPPPPTPARSAADVADSSRGTGRRRSCSSSSRVQRTARSAERLTEEIVRLHLDLCDGVAARYSGRGGQAEDLSVQVARLALLVAIRQFSTLAQHVVRSARSRRSTAEAALPGPRLDGAPRHASSGARLRASSRVSTGSGAAAARTRRGDGVDDYVIRCYQRELALLLLIDLTFGDDESRSLAGGLAEPQEELRWPPTASPSPASAIPERTWAARSRQCF